MPRNTRTTGSRKDSALEDRSRPNEGTKMHGSRSNESDRELRMGKNKNENGPPKSSSRTRRTPRGH